MQMTTRIRFLGLAVSLALVALATLTPATGGGAATAVWCLTCRDAWLTDALSNVALFIPLGITLGVCGVRWRQTVLLCSALSLVIEYLQHLGLPAGRTPSFPDWIMNSAGAMLGATGFVLRETLRSPPRVVARTLAAGWSTLLMVLMIGASWAFSPAFGGDDTGIYVRPSQLPFTPRYGWFSGFATNAVVNGTPVGHRGNGPVIVESALRDRTTGSVDVRGRDRRRETVPIVFVHARGSSWPMFLLGQHGDGVIAQSTLMGQRIGLTSAPLLARTRFTVADTSVSLRLLATAGRGTLALRVQSSGSDAEVRRTLRPEHGWVLLQPVAGLNARGAPVLTALWVVSLFCVGGFFVGRATNARALGPALWCVAVLASVNGGASLWRMPFMAVTSPVLAMAATGCGALLSRHVKE